MRPSVSIVIKALNEESNIARCLESAVSEARPLGGEVILADSISTDRTIEIAHSFPVRIVQLERSEDRGCGATAQLGYQFVRGRYLYLLDADMRLCPGFIETAMNFLDANPSVGGVGGLLIDTHVRTLTDKLRAARYSEIGEKQIVRYLGGGGLYRTEAIESVGYLANRWLKACEEADLGLRLRSRGWELVRLPVHAVHHTGHNESTPHMLMRLWKSGRMAAYGSFLRYAFLKPWWGESVRVAWFVVIAPVLHILAVTISWWFVSIGHEFVSSFAAASVLIWGSAFSALLVKKGGIVEAMASIAAWHLYSVASIQGFLRAAPDPLPPLRARNLTVYFHGSEVEKNADDQSGCRSPASRSP
jgi:glycosyltransferase involved in cell wall biosynthesis